MGLSEPDTDLGLNSVTHLHNAPASE